MGAAPRFSLQTESTSRSSSFLRRGLWCPDSVTRAVWRGAELRACRPSQQETDATSPSVAGTSSPWPEHPARSSNQSGSRRCCWGLCSSPAPHLPPALQRGGPVEPCAFLPLVFIIEMLLALNQQPVLRCQLWELVPGPWAFLASSCNAAVSPSFQSPSVFRGLVNTDSRRRPGSGVDSAVRCPHLSPQQRLRLSLFFLVLILLTCTGQEFCRTHLNLGLLVCSCRRSGVVHMVLCDDALLSCVWSGGDRVVPCWNGTCQAALGRVLSFPSQSRLVGHRLRI